MKVKAQEEEGCFGVTLEAETMAEGALLTRLGMNATSEIRYCRANANRDGTFTWAIVFAKHRRADCEIPKRR